MWVFLPVLTDRWVPQGLHIFVFPVPWKCLPYKTLEKMRSAKYRVEVMIKSKTLIPVYESDKKWE
jgi:hypothetical protein